MVIGYVLLGLIAVMMFFGLLSGVSKSMKLEPWVALLFIVAFIVGGIVPMIPIGSVITFGIGGFIVPIVLSVILTIFVGYNMEFLKTAAAMLATAAITIAVTIWMPMNSAWLSILATFVIGLLSGAVAYGICGTRLASAAGAIGGIVIGNIVGQMIIYFTGMSTIMVLGGAVIFDAIVVALVFTVILASVSASYKADNSLRRGTSVEAAEENDELSKFDDYLNK